MSGVKAQEIGLEWLGEGTDLAAYFMMHSKTRVYVRDSQSRISLAASLRK